MGEKKCMVKWIKQSKKLTMKKCSKCHLLKEFTCFHRCKLISDGYRSECKVCRKLDSTEYYEKNKPQILDSVKEYKLNNLEKVKQSKLKYRLNNKKTIKLINKDYREKNRNRIKEYQHNNRDILKIKRRIYIKNKRINDLIFKLKHDTGNLIRISFNSNGLKKNTKTQVILGCTFEKFKQHLESKFESWMNWDNKGLYNGNFNYGWDVDHIIPLSSAKTEEDVIRLNHYTNLQPLCSKINREIKRGFWKSNLSNKSD